MIYYFLAVLTGFFLTLTPVINGQNTLSVGSRNTSFYHFLSATLTGCILFLILGSFSDIKSIPTVNPIYFSGAALGLFVVTFMNYFSPKIEAIYISLLPFLGQMVIGMLIDMLMLDLFEIKKLVGISIVLLGIAVMNIKKTEP